MLEGWVGDNPASSRYLLDLAVMVHNRCFFLAEVLKYLASGPVSSFLFFFPNSDTLSESELCLDSPLPVDLLCYCTVLK